jgi:hypothetical protein
MTTRRRKEERWLDTIVWEIVEGIATDLEVAWHCHHDHHHALAAEAAMQLLDQGCDPSARESA